MNITTLKKEPKNKIFFDNARYHGDKSYKILKNDTLLQVNTNHGKVFYKLHGSKIGDHIRTEEDEE